MKKTLYNILKQMKNKTVDLNYGRNIIVRYACNKIFSKKIDSVNILDLGAGSGTDLLNIKKAVHDKESDITVNLYAVESYQPNIDHLEKLGVETAAVDIENESLPFAENMFDIIVINQVLEHTKEIFWIFAEMQRVLKPGGQVILGVPNLASLHNRIALLFGQQPTCIKVLGPHVRGYCSGSLSSFIEENGYFKVCAVAGSNFYPFPAKISQPLSKCFPNLSVSIFLDIRKTDKSGRFTEILDTHFLETPYRR